MKLLKFTKRLPVDRQTKNIFFLFLLWKIGLFLVSIFVPYFIALRGKDFFGSGIENYLKAPWFFGWANFDGEHYLSIAQTGYKSLEQAFFPVYPFLIHMLSIPLGNNSVSLIFSGLVISNLSFIISLIFLWKLIKIDYSSTVSWLTILLILVFPTSFFFGAVYSESIFLLLSIIAFFCARKDKWFLAGLFGAVASATRVFGILLLPSLLLETWQKKQKLSSFFWVFIIPFGFLAYMYYQWILVGDPFAFYNLQKIVGPQHDAGVTFLPQIYFRYIKIIFTTQISNPVFQTILLEFFVGVLFLILPIYGFSKKMRFPYIFYALFSFILPTIQGSFSSLPRYVIVLFPSFLAAALFLNKIGRFSRAAILVLSFSWLILETALFFRGYWIA